MARNYRSPEESAAIDRKRQQYYESLCKGEVSLPVHDFSNQRAASVPPPNVTQRRSPVEFKSTSGMVPIDTATPDVKAALKSGDVTRGALIEDEEVGLKPGAGIPKTVDVVDQDDSVRSALDSSTASQVPTTPAQIAIAKAQGVYPDVDAARVQSSLDGSVPNEIPTTDVQKEIAANQGVDVSDAVTKGVVAPPIEKTGESDNESGSESEDVVPIPDNWRDLPWNDVRALARNFTDEVVTNKDSALGFIEAELKRRNEV